MQQAPIYLEVALRKTSPMWKIFLPAAGQANSTPLLLEFDF
jgi:hypothetical protein